MLKLRRSLQPGKEQSVALALPAIVAKPGVEYFLRVSFKLAKDELWAKAGHEVAWQQFKLPAAAPAPVAAVAAMKPLTVSNDKQGLTISGAGFAVKFDKASGIISALERDGINLLAADGGPQLHLWRAAHRTDDMWAFNEWKRYGLVEPKWTTMGSHWEHVAPNTLRFTVTHELVSVGNFRLSHTAAYTIYGDGSIAVDNCVIPQGKKIPFARLGVRLMLDQKLDQFAYLGRGPMENYADRKRGFDVGLFTSTVRGNMTPYAKPMENGNHEDVRWATVTGQGLPGLMAQAEAGGVLQASALPYTDEQMDPVEYTIDLPPSKASVLVLGARTTGVGSNGCGPRPADEYIVWSEPATFSYVLRLLPAGADAPTLGRVQAPANRVQPVLATRDWDGKVTLTCATPGAKIKYALSTVQMLPQPYSSPIAAPDAMDLIVVATAAGMIDFTGEVVLGPLDPRARWKATASSFEKGEGEPGNAIDGQSGTFWHSRWSGTVASHPHWLKIDFGKSLNIAAITYLPRQGGNANGRVKNYELYLSTDGKQWGQPVAKGAFKGKDKEETIKLTKPATGRYLKLVALSETAGQKYASVAELDVVEAK